MTTKIKGMDISNYQGKITVANFKKAKDSGIKFVILKLGYTGYSKYECKLDDSFENNYKNAKAAGLPVGVYYYSLANGPLTAKEEAEFTIKHLKGKTLEYPVYLDVEDSTYRQKNASKKNLADACDSWCKVIAAAGFMPGIYASTSWFNNKIGEIKEKHTKWVAQYYKVCEYKGNYDIWQYSSTEGVPGISSKTDVNWCYKEFIKDIVPQEKEKVNLIAYEGTLPKLPSRGYFKRGDDSEQVKLLQLYLNWYGNYELVIDTVVGSKTIEAVGKFQKDQGLSVDGLFGKKCLKIAKTYKKKEKVEKEEKKDELIVPHTYNGDFPSLHIKKSNKEVIEDTIAWAKMIVKDNRFHYGYTNSSKSINAHHNGCYFCDTQGSNKNGILDKKYTYCCNPFVHAAWAHGGQVPSMLKMCKHGSSYDFQKGTGYDASSLFRNLGKPKRSNLKPGDVLCRDNHVSLYIGNGKIAEAYGGDDNVRSSRRWNHSIRIRRLTAARYAGYKRVHRFNSTVDTTKPLEYGDINKEIKKLKKFLNWYGNYGLVINKKYMDDTLKAVKNFQKKEGLKADGVVGQKTIEKMKKVMK